MIRPSYCTPIDVLRRFDPNQTQQDLDRNTLFEDQDTERLRARIDGVGSDFDSRTGNPLRLTREGSPGTPATFEYSDNTYWKRQPSQIYLEHRNVLPFDPEQGDALQIRTGIDNWRDITHDRGDRWTANWRMGKLELYARVRGRKRHAMRRGRGDRFVRACYRHGALGGDQRAGGQTTIATALEGSTDGTDPTTPTTVDVADASRLPNGGGVLLVTADGVTTEYVRVGAVDAANDTVMIRSRGARATQAVAHESGATIHYCPLNVREAVAAQAARELVLFDDWADRAAAPDDVVDSGQKLDTWQTEFEETVAQYTEGGYA